MKLITKLMMLIAFGVFITACGNKEAAKEAEEEKMIHELDSAADVFDEAADKIEESAAKVDEALQELEEDVEEEIEQKDEQ